jgi:plastocyanin domain-containing protein
MNVPKLLIVPLVSAILVAAPAALALEHDGDATHDLSVSAKPATNAKGAQVVELTVTKDGFVPSTVTVKHGKPVKLVVTRKVERTCATDIVSKDLGVNQPLPLDTPVTVKVTPKKPGAYRFACAMDMIGGTLKVE